MSRTRSIRVPSCPICGTKIVFAGIVDRLPGPDEEHVLFGLSGERFIKHVEGAHCHFKRFKNGRQIEAYAYIRELAQ